MGRKKTVSDANLLEVARAVFIEQGLGASTKEIARRAGVSEGVIYQRFATKDELFFAAMIPPPADVTRLFQHSRLSGRKLIEKLTLSMLEFSRQALPVMLPLMMHPEFRLEDLAERQPESPIFVLRREIGPFLLRERNAGRLGPVDPRGASLLVWSLAQALAFFERLGAHGGKFDPEIIESAIECMWKGLAPKPHRRRKLRPKASSPGS
ncbi:MAG TPA: helix-turn-helix domain-containing protein [Bryobacteraceae bacterium]|nr:helix-turn-helix domain-containing protein [Bryobacteraceae bacterium]